MRRSAHARPWVLAACIVASVTWVQGCSSLTTRVAGWYVTHKIDSYLDLTSDQKSWLRAGIDRELDVIRRHDLPRWLYLVRQVRDTIATGATEAKIIALQARYDLLMNEAVDKLAPKLALLLSKLSDEQIDHFEAKMRETLDETYDEQRLPEAERREELDERLVEGLEELVGDLREKQKRTLIQTVHALPDERPVQYRVGKERIRDAAKFLKGQPGAAAIEAEIRRLWATRYEVLGPGRDTRERRAEQRGVMLTIDRSLSREQREHAVKTLNDGLRKAKRFVLPAEG